MLHNWSPYSDSVSLWLRQERLNLQHTANSVAHSTKGTQSPNKLSSYLLEGIKVSGYYFTPLAGVLFTFPSRYLFTIGQTRYLVLERDRPGFPQGFSCLVVLRYKSHSVSIHFTYGTVTLYGGPIPGSFCYKLNFLHCGLPPLLPYNPIL